MARAKKLLKKLLYPPLWFLCSISFFAATALIFTFMTGNTKRMSAYLSYGLSAYALIIVIAAIPRTKRLLKSKKANFFKHSQLIKMIRTTRFGTNYLQDTAFRGSISIYQGMTANYLYAIFRLLTGIYYGSIWFLSMAVYHFILGILRTYLICQYRSLRTCSGQISEEYQCYGKTAGFLFLLNIPMGSMILLMIRTNSGFSYPGFVIYLSALYTFYMLILSIVNLVKYRKIGSPILSAAKVLNLISALMSILGLQTAMITRFSQNGESYRRLMNTLTGSGVYFCVILFALYMLFHSHKERRILKMNRSESKYFNTAVKMDKALLSLLETKDFEYITIKEICQKAGVNRSTFYLHYQNTSELLEESVAYTQQEFLTYFDETHQQNAVDGHLISPEYLIPYLTYIKEHQKLFQTILHKNIKFESEKIFTYLFENFFDPAMEKQKIPVAKRKYLIKFYIHGILAVIQEWLHQGCKEPMEDIVTIILQCVSEK